jgi:hypothetical protein
MDVTQTLADKLLIKAESKVLILNAPIGYARKLQPLPDGATVSDRRSSAAMDVALVFVRDAGELRRLQSGFATIEEDAALWVCYPSGGRAAGSDLSPEVIGAALKSDELVEAATVAFDERWTCLRFRTPEDAGE